MLIDNKYFFKFYNLIFLLFVYILVYYTGERAAFYLLSLYIFLNFYFYFTKKYFIKISLLLSFLFIIFYFTGSYERMFVQYKNLENQNISILGGGYIGVEMLDVLVEKYPDKKFV